MASVKSCACSMDAMMLTTFVATTKTHRFHINGQVPAEVLSRNGLCATVQAT